MNRNIPEEIRTQAVAAAAEDYRRHVEKGYDLNPYSTPGARNDWQRGYDNAPARPWEETTHAWDTMYQRGRAAAELVEKMKGEAR